VNSLRDPVSVFQRDDQHHGDYCQRDPHSLQPAQETDSGKDRGENREVDGHGKVFENQDGQDHGRFTVTDAAQIGNDLRRDA
jgi:hypothetical protein